MSERKRSAVWLYFNAESETTASCIVCNRVVKYSRNSTNLYKHMKNHAAENAELQKRREEERHPPFPAPDSPRPSTQKQKSLAESFSLAAENIQMMRGPESCLFWFTTTETLYEGVPYYSKFEDSFTGVQVVSGTVTEFICCNRVETTITLPRAADVESEYNLTPEEMEVPFISCHLLDRGVTAVGLKLSALRQAFSTLLASIHNQNFLFVVGKKIVMHLAAANNQDVGGVRLAYEALIRFLRPSNQVSIEAELSRAQLHHYNFLDVFYELLLLFGYFKNGSVPEAFIGGFLVRLVELVRLGDVDVWEPAAEQYFTLLIDELTVLCEVLFDQQLELYSDPAALASTVSHLLRQHVQRMMDTLERL